MLTRATQPSLSLFFSTNEQEALVQFHHVWADVAAKTPDPLPDLVVLFDHSEWKRLRDAAHEALAVFQVRGQVSEDQELVG